MKMNEVRIKAKDLGIVKTGRVKKESLIIRIQQTEISSEACFKAPWRMRCAENNCCWRNMCQTA